jgi:hypothetical protein
VFEVSIYNRRLDIPDGVAEAVISNYVHSGEGYKESPSFWGLECPAFNRGGALGSIEAGVFRRSRFLTRNRAHTLSIIQGV